MEGKVYLKGINGLRAICAIGVVVGHLNQSLDKFNLSKLGKFSLAGYGVTVFFSISGFLITYLLLKEKEVQAINIKHFYTRRILRIWPLYFLILGLSILTAYIYLPSIFYQKKYIYLFYIFLMANIPFTIHSNAPLLGHYWSLGIEEQFYLFWPWVIKKTNRVFPLLISIICLFTCLRIIIRILDIKFGYPLLYDCVLVNRFDCMAIGSLGAVILYKNHIFLLNIMMTKMAQCIAWLVIILICFNKFHIASVIDDEIISFVAVILIINLSQNKNSLINLDFKLFNFLGKISYGIYLIHQIVIFYSAKLIININMPYMIKLPLVYIVVIGGTIILSYLSYEFFEKKFLLLKEKYTIIKSTNSKHN